MRSGTVAVMAFVWLGSGAWLSAGEIEQLYRKWVRPKESETTAQDKRFERLQEPQHGVTEIGLERTPCFGDCPVYSVVIKSDGTFRYVGEENVARKGTHTGEISTWDFNQLAEFIVESGYMNLETNYDAPITDLPATYTTVVLNGKRKLVRNYGGLGPVRLWMLEQAIDSTLNQAQWGPQPEKNGRP